jgi:hypothetical protein
VVYIRYLYYILDQFTLVVPIAQVAPSNHSETSGYIIFEQGPTKFLFKCARNSFGSSSKNTKHGLPRAHCMKLFIPPDSIQQASLPAWDEFCYGKSAIIH